MEGAALGHAGVAEKQQQRTRLHTSPLPSSGLSTSASGATTAPAGCAAHPCGMSALARALTHRSRHSVALTARHSRLSTSSSVRRRLSSMAAAASSSPSSQELAAQSCSLLGGCSSSTPEVPAEQLPGLLAALPAWALADDAKSISRSFTAKNFSAAIDFFNRVKEVAEAEGHHPDLHLTNYRDVQVVLSTHAIGGLSMFDVIVAAKLDQLPVEVSPKWAKAHPHLQPGGGQAAAPGAAGQS